MVSQGADIAVLGNLARSLIKAETLPEIKTLRDKAEAARAYAKAAHMGLELQNRAAEFKLRAERKAGALLARLIFRGGDRRSVQARRRLSLDDLGISRSQSRKWQLVASIPEAEFDRFLARKKSDAEEITLAEALRMARCKPQSNANRQVKSQGTERTEQVAPHDERALGPLEIVSELQNHQKLLRQMLECVVSEDSASMPRPQQKLTQRLLMESEVLLQQLEKTLSDLTFNVLASEVDPSEDHKADYA